MDTIYQFEGNRGPIYACSPVIFGETLYLVGRPNPKHMLQAILVDDESLALQSLQADLQLYCADEVQVVASCSSPILALTAIRRHQPDVVFLDIGMESYGTNGFDILEILGEFHFSVIFVTAHDESDYLLKAFKVAAVDYLVKPFSPQSLQEAVAKAKRHRQVASGSVIQDLVSELRHTDVKHPEQISIPVAEGFRYLIPEKIMYCMADGAYTRFFLEDGSPFMSSKGLKEVEQLLPPTTFFRIHYSHLINRYYLKTFLSKGKGTYQVIMLDGQELIVSRKRKQDFLAWMDI